MLELRAHRDAVAARVEREDIAEQARAGIGDVETGHRVAVEDVLDEAANEPAIIASIQLDRCIRLDKWFDAVGVFSKSNLHIFISKSSAHFGLIIALHSE